MPGLFVMTGHGKRSRSNVSIIGAARIVAQLKK